MEAKALKSEKATAEAAAKSDDRMQIFVRDFASAGAAKTLTLDVEPSDSVSDVKGRIWVKNGVPPEYQIG
jgi:hypothetical protein